MRNQALKVMSEQLESRDLKIKRLIYQSWHRGCKETDILMGDFAKACLHELDDNLLEQYEALCAVDDWDLYAWLTGNVAIPANFDNEIMNRLIAFHQDHQITES